MIPACPSAGRIYRYTLVTGQGACKGSKVGEGSGRLPGGSNIPTGALGESGKRGHQPRTESPNLAKPGGYVVWEGRTA